MRTSVKAGLVLVVERDASLRKMIGIVLRRAGFSTRSVRDAEAAAALLGRTRVDVIVRDLTDGIAQLASTSPDVLRRTVIATTAPDGVLKDVAASVFAVIRKPFDIDELVRVVGACAAAKWGSHRRPAPDLINALQRFVTNVPSLRRALNTPGSTQREMLLRIEMRRAMLQLSAAFHEAADTETSRTRSAAFRAASAVAAELASRPAMSARASALEH